jgi:hypothetical protein
LNRRKQTRLRQGAKRVNSILGGAVSFVWSRSWNAPFLESIPSYNCTAAFASFPGAGQ